MSHERGEAVLGRGCGATANSLALSAPPHAACHTVLRKVRPPCRALPCTAQYNPVVNCICPARRVAFPPVQYAAAVAVVLFCQLGCTARLRCKWNDPVRQRGQGGGGVRARRTYRVKSPSSLPVLFLPPSASFLCWDALRRRQPTPSAGHGSSERGAAWRRRVAWVAVRPPVCLSQPDRQAGRQCRIA